jgi:hypothetical protein
VDVQFETDSCRDEMRHSRWCMPMRNEPWAAITMVILCMAFRSPSLDYETLMQFVVCSAACGVAWRIGKEGKYVLAAAFAGIAALFNPMAPLMLSPAVFSWVGLASVVMFVHALDLVEPAARMPVASIADGIKRSDSVDAVWAWKR